MRDEGASVIRLALCPRAAIVEQVRLKLFDPVLEMGDVTEQEGDYVPVGLTGRVVGDRRGGVLRLPGLFLTIAS
jgi:hypothetical protein